MWNPFRSKQKGDLLGTSPSGNVQIIICDHLKAFRVKTPFSSILGSTAGDDDSNPNYDVNDLYIAIQESREIAKKNNSDIVVAELTEYLFQFDSLDSLYVD